jgi:hypothetical protein
MNPYTHSNVARSIVNSLAIAKLIKPSETFEGRITSKHVVNKTTKVFTLEITTPNVDYQVPPSTSIETIGKHYLMRSLSNRNVRRHYTVSSCMKRETYQEYLNAIKQFREKKPSI